MIRGSVALGAWCALSVACDVWAWGIVCLGCGSVKDVKVYEDERMRMLHVYPVQEKDDNKECVYCVWGVCVCVCSLATCEGIEPLCTRSY